LPAPRCAYALAVFSDTLYLFGGWDGQRYVATSYTYDPGSDAWRELPPMTMERGFAAAASLENSLFVVGGYDGAQELDTCARYDPTEGAWSACASLSVGRGGLGLIALNGRLYAVGGGGWSSYLGFNERYDPGSDVWNPVETPLVAEWRGPGVVMFDTSIYAIGGVSGDLLSLNQVYEPLSFHIFIPVSRSD
jgi:N-acetylneuraminic acid mutarotase